VLVARRVRKLRADDLRKLHVPLRRVLPFVVLADHRPGAMPQRVQRMEQPALF
jgi:predicted DNA-binding helix-hairpin-helix protein